MRVDASAIEREQNCTVYPGNVGRLTTQFMQLRPIVRLLWYFVALQAILMILEAASR